MDNVVAFEPGQRGRQTSRTTGHHPCAGHERFESGSVALELCLEDGTPAWSDAGRAVGGDEAAAILFGDFDLVGVSTGLGAPGRRLLAYRPPRRARSRLAGFPSRRWLPLTDRLWFAHDDELLLLAPSDDAVVDRLTR